MFADKRAVVGFATLSCLLWGSAVPMVKVGYGLIGIASGDTAALVLFAGIRFTLGGLMLLIWSVATRRSIALAPRRVGEMALLGFGQTALQYVFYYVGLAHTTGVKVAIMTSTNTFFAVLFAHVLHANDRLTARRALGCLIGFAGVVAVNFAASTFDFHFTLLGEGFIVISALIASIAALYGRRLSQAMDAAVMTGWQLFLGGLMLTAAGLAGGGRFQSFGLAAAGLTTYLAAVSAVAFALWSLLLKHNPVSSIAVYNFQIPIFGAVLSALVLGESVLEWKNLVALVLVSAGIWLVTTRGRVSPI